MGTCLLTETEKKCVNSNSKDNYPPRRKISRYTMFLVKTLFDPLMRRPWDGNGPVPSTIEIYKIIWLLVAI